VTRPSADRRTHRGVTARAARPADSGVSALRRLDRLGLAGGGLLLAALAGVALATPGLPLPYRLASVAVLLLSTGAALGLRRRFWRALDDELRRCRQLQQSARAGEQAKDQLLARVSHDMRTPMHGILGLTDLLLRGGPEAEQREHVELMRTSAETLLGLAEDVLDVSRIDAGRLQLRPRDFQLREAVGEVVRLLAAPAVEREVDLRLHVDADLPDTLHGDPVRLRQVLLNLVGNAVRFTRRGLVTVSVGTEGAEEREPEIRFEIRDTGVGVRREDQARLFEPFAQAGSPGSGVLSGSGLGLAISKSIVELMGGEIGFESARGVGSTFWFRLPLQHARGTAGTPASLSAPADDAARRLARRQRRVLVVDDRGVNRAVGLAMLGELGFTAEAAAGGEEALEMLQEGRFDAVLLDCEMPGVDGIETCRRLRAKEAAGEPGRRLPVIAVTAHRRPEDVARCLTAGMDDRLIKPFGTAELAAVLDRSLGFTPPASSGDELAARLAALRHLDGTTGESTVATFLRQGEEDLARLRRALPEGDGEAAAEAAHALAGSAGLLGAAELAERASEVATLARRGDVGGSRRRLPALERAWRETARRIEA